MNRALRRRINKMLGEHGLGQLDHPGLVNQLAYLVRDHDHFRSLLIACEPDKRTDMFNAMAPNLRFKARTLEQYLTEARADAEARRLPIQAEDGTLKEFQIPEVKTSALDPETSQKAPE